MDGPKTVLARMTGDPFPRQLDTRLLIMPNNFSDKNNFIDKS